MLVEFRTKNFKSFVDEACFSMLAAPKQKGLDYSILQEKIKGRRASLKGLCSSVIYGPNASGKTNIIEAMDVLQAIIDRGNIRNPKEMRNPNAPSSFLEVIPNRAYAEPKPVEFAVVVTVDGTLFKYELILDLGVFFEAAYPRSIIEETFTVNDNEIFRRSPDDIKINDVRSISDYLYENVKSTQGLKNEVANAKERLVPYELFLTNGFRLFFSGNIVKKFVDYMLHKFRPIPSFYEFHMGLLSRDKKSTILIEASLNKALKNFGVENDIGYIIDEKDPVPRLGSVFHLKEGKERLCIPAKMYESLGTLRFVEIFQLIQRAFARGEVLIIDEFDASIHPMAIMSLLNVFHNDEINVNHAQLIFNTHNPIFLNSNLLRRDEIKFVERDEVTGGSVIYSLADFGTSGKNGVRKHEDYMRNYFINQYGAIRDIDFTPAFEDMLKEPNQEKPE